MLTSVIQGLHQHGNVLTFFISSRAASNDTLMAKNIGVRALNT